MFYIHRNDLNFTLVMLKQMTYAFGVAWLMAKGSSKLFLHRGPDRVTAGRT